MANNYNFGKTLEKTSKGGVLFKYRLTLYLRSFTKF